MAEDLSRSNPDDDFNWKGEAGEKMADWNPASAKDKDKEWMEFYGKTATDVLSRALEAMKAKGLEPGKAKVLDVGCSTGGVLEVLETLGFNPENLQGIDLSPKAIEINKKAHPKYQLKIVDGFNYGQWEMDLLLHTGVLCQVPEEDYDKFFAKIRELKPRFYMFVEGINPRGYEKIPNSEAHKHHDGGGHDHHHAHGKDEAHVPMEEGYHHTNDVEKVVEKYFPDSVKVFTERLDPTEMSKKWFLPLHMEYCKANVYMFQN